jgi:hypothetical protein
MWNVKVKVIPLRVGANGTISKSFRQYLSKARNELRKTATLCTAEGTNVHVKNIFNTSSNITCITTNCYCRIAATLYTLETWFFSGIVHNCKYPEYGW